MARPPGAMLPRPAGPEDVLELLVAPVVVVVPAALADLADLVPVAGLVLAVGLVSAESLAVDEADPAGLVVAPAEAERSRAAVPAPVDARVAATVAVLVVTTTTTGGPRASSRRRRSANRSRRSTRTCPKMSSTA